VGKPEGKRPLEIHWHRCEAVSELHTWKIAILVFSHLNTASVRNPFPQVILSKLCMNFCLMPIPTHLVDLITTSDAEYRP